MMINLQQIDMNKILIIPGLFTMACSNNASHETTHENEHEMDTAKVAKALQLNNGARWKTDEVTRKMLPPQCD